MTLSVYGAHGWALSWASAPARCHTACWTIWPGSPGPWRGAGALPPGGRLHPSPAARGPSTLSLPCCPGAVYAGSPAAQGPSTLAPLREPRPGTLCPAAASPSLPPARSLGFLTPTPLHSASRGPGWEGGRWQGLWLGALGALGALLCVRAPL